jgi:hypothetical protein
MCVVNRVTAQEGAAGIATAVAESVQYQGRKASRQGSEQRRQTFSMPPCASSCAMACAPCATARWPPRPACLSATTYYFKDIDDLLTDTFAQYVERSAAFMAKLWVQRRPAARDGRHGDGSPQARSQLADDIARLTADYAAPTEQPPRT